MKDKTFFFVDYEGYRLTQGVANLLTVPTAKMRAGDFSELATQIFDPTDDAADGVCGQRDSRESARSDRVAADPAVSAA